MFGFRHHRVFGSHVIYLHILQLKLQLYTTKKKWHTTKDYLCMPSPFG